MEMHGSTLAPDGIQPKLPQSADPALGKPYYCVVFTQTLKQWNAAQAIIQSLPEGRGEVFYPSVELWWHGMNRPKLRTLFPGYLFVRSELPPAELHEAIRLSRQNITSFLKELKMTVNKTAGNIDFDDNRLVDLNERETELFDMLLGFSYDADLAERVELARDHGKLYLTPEMAEKIRKKNAKTGLNAQEFLITDEAGEDELSGQKYGADHMTAAGMAKADKVKAAMLKEFKRRRRDRVTQKGVLQISFGYMDNGKQIVVMDGPLRGKEKYIKSYKMKDQKAFLDVSMAGQPMTIKAGLIMLGKRVWFPGDKNALELLADDTEVDCAALARSMTGSGVYSKETEAESKKNT